MYEFKGVLAYNSLEWVWQADSGMHPRMCSPLFVHAYLFFPSFISRSGSAGVQGWAYSLTLQYNNTKMT